MNNSDKESTQVPSGKLSPIPYIPGEDPPYTTEPRKVVAVIPNAPVKSKFPKSTTIHRSSTRIICSNCSTQDFSNGVYNHSSRIYCSMCAP